MSVVDLGVIEAPEETPPERGVCYRGHLLAGYTASGPNTIPLLIVKGAEDGPRVGITAGVHASEYTGQFAAKELARRVDPAKLRGELRISPAVNRHALDLRHSFYSPVDGQNINQSFPGERFGSFAAHMAWTIRRHFIEGSDAYLDLHSGDLFEIVPLHVVVPETGRADVDEASRAIADCFDIPILNVMGPGIDDVAGGDEDGRIAWRGLDATRNNFGSAASSGVPAVQLEVGGGGRLDPALVALEADGLENLLRHLGMVDGEAVRYDHAQTAYGMSVISSDLGGHFEPAVSPGDAVTEGTLLGRYTDVFGSVLGDVHCPLEGVVLMLFTTPVRNSGEPCCIVGLRQDPRR